MAKLAFITILALFPSQNPPADFSEAKFSDWPETAQLVGRALPATNSLVTLPSVGGQERLQLLEIGFKDPLTLPGQLSKRNSDAVWSADGTQIAFSSERGP